MDNKQANRLKREFSLRSLKNFGQKFKHLGSAKRIGTGIILVAALWSVAVVLLFSIHFLKAGFSNDLANWGQFGDFLGGVLNPAIGIVNLYLLYRIATEVREHEKRMIDYQIRYEAYRTFCMVTESLLDSIKAKILALDMNKPGYADNLVLELDDLGRRIFNEIDILEPIFGPITAHRSVQDFIGNFNLQTWLDQLPRKANQVHPEIPVGSGFERFSALDVLHKQVKFYIATQVTGNIYSER